MTGTWINITAILIGAALGSLLGQRIPQRLKVIVTQGVGLVVLAVGIDMALESEQVLIMLFSILLGGLLGEWWSLDDRLSSLGGWLERLFASVGFPTEGDFIQGFVTATVVFCVGPMAVLGSIQDGLTGDYTLLGIKSVLDGFSSLVFSSALGVGVGFSALSVLVVQGAFSLGADALDALLTSPMLAEISGTGGVLMIGIALVMLDIKQLRIANFLPSLMVAPLIQTILHLLGVS